MKKYEDLEAGVYFLANDLEFTTRKGFKILCMAKIDGVPYFNVVDDSLYNKNKDRPFTDTEKQKIVDAIKEKKLDVEIDGVQYFLNPYKGKDYEIFYEGKKKKKVNPKVTPNMTLEEVMKHVDKRFNEHADNFDEKRTEHVIRVKKHKTVKRKNMVTHERFPLVLALAVLRIPQFLVGSPGTGKSHIAGDIAKSLGLDFRTKPVGAQTTESSLMGYMDANGVYRRTHFRDCYENGGVYLMDELDAGNPQVILVLNAALSNGACGFPDAMVDMHEDFVFISTGNTIGQGANREFIGRNAIDMATLDRFAYVDFDIDEGLEGFQIGLTAKTKPLDIMKAKGVKTSASGWIKRVRHIRKSVDEKKFRVMITPRATTYGHKMLSYGIKQGYVEECLIWSKVPFELAKQIKKEVGS